MEIYIQTSEIENKIIWKMSNFAMGTILGKGFAQAQVHTRVLVQ